jgi:parallel beta-helix repeat protein
MIPKTPLIAILLAAAPSVLAQGSLTPPSGPAPSMKTLGQIEPRTVIEALPFSIAREGSYYLATNLFVPSGTNGITIQASHVSLDLGGFTIRGGSTSKDAILIAGGQANISIANGNIVSTGTGINGGGASKVSVRAVSVANTSSDGIVLGDDGTVTDSKANITDGVGILTGLRGQVLNCQATQNFGPGIQVGAGSTVRDSRSSRNAAAGVVGGNHSFIAGVTAQENAEFGIDAGNNANVIDCTASQNKQGGVRVQAYSLVSRTTASYNQTIGVTVAVSSSVLDCNVSANGWLGIVAGPGAQIANTKAEGNAGGGISAQEGSTVRDCTASRNGNDGILVTSECTVIRNNCNNNVNIRSASGIHATGTDNVIQENTMISNDRGLALDTAGNLVTKNSATNNSLNYYVIGEQTMAPIVTSFEGAEPVTPASNFAF